MYAFTKIKAGHLIQLTIGAKIMWKIDRTMNTLRLLLAIYYHALGLFHLPHGWSSWSHCSQCMELTYVPHIACTLWLYMNNTHRWQASTQVQGLVAGPLKPLSHRLPLSSKHTKDCTIMVFTYSVTTYKKEWLHRNWCILTNTYAEKTHLLNRWERGAGLTCSWDPRFLHCCSNVLHGCWTTNHSYSI